jgi:hypothetical protein
MKTIDARIQSASDGKILMPRKSPDKKKHTAPEVPKNLNMKNKKRNSPPKFRKFLPGTRPVQPVQQGISANRRSRSNFSIQNGSTSIQTNSPTHCQAQKKFLLHEIPVEKSSSTLYLQFQ